MQHKPQWRTSTWLRMFCLILLGMTGTGAFAQTDVIIGAGALSATSSNGATGDFGPIYRSSAASAFDFSLHHHLFTQAELAAIPSGSQITKISWFMTNGAATTGNAAKWNIWMKNSSLTSAVAVPTTFAAVTAGSTLVYASSSQAIVGPAGGGWVEFTLSTPFIYNGGALEITLDWDISNVAGNPTTNGFAWKNDLISNRVVSYVGSVASTAIANARTARAQTRFTYTGGSPCSGTPSPGNTIASNTAPCPGTSITLSLQNSTAGSGVTYQWYNSGGPIAGATSSAYSTVVSAANSYYCTVTCSGLSGTSNPVSVSLASFTNCYCASSATSTADEEISNVTFGSLNNSSTCTTLAPGPGSVVSMYSNYKSGAGAPAPVPVTQGQTIPFSVTQTSCGGAYGNRFAIFIDWNQNGLFTDAGENVFQQAASVTGNQTVTGTITIPFTSIPGQTAMRVINVETAAAIAPCGTYTWGETEDYLIDIQAAVPCSGTPAPGNTIASTLLACPGSTVNFSLQNFTNGVNVTYQWYNNGGAIPGATNSFYSQVMTAADDVYCDVTCPTASPATTSSSLASVTLNSYLNCYCPANSSFGTSGGFYGIVNNVSMAGINNTTTYPAASPYYTNYAAGAGTTTNVLPGIAYPLSILVGQYSQVGVWFDWNQSGTFDASEFTFLGNNTAAAPATYSATINVPITAPPGLIKMRVRSEAYFYANLTGTQACGLTNYGETEDYTITVDALVPCTGTPAPGNTLASNSTPCPGTSVTFTLQNNTAGTGVSYQWYNNSGAVAGATNSFYTQVMTAADDVYCDVTCAAGGTTSSGLASITLAPFLNCYCASNATSTADEEISNVTFGSLNNSSTCTTLAPGPGSVVSMYSNYKSGTGAPSAPVLTIGSLVPFSLTQTTCGGNFSNKFAIFIDWNQNGLFTDAGENVYQQATAAIGNQTVTGNVSVPLTAVTGTTAMRVINVETTGAISPCGTYTWGETEDYLINVQPSTNCSGQPVPGNTLSTASAVCPGSTVTLSLQNNVSGTGITFQWNDNSGPIAGATNPFYTATITASNTFYCDVTCSFSSQTGSSSLITVNTNPFLNCYCASAATTTADEEIYSVTVNGSTTPAAYAGVAGCSTPAPGPGSLLSRYSNFTTLGTFATMQEGAPVSFTVEENECDGATFYAFGTAIFIDYNHNGLFTDPGEKVFVEATTATGPRNVVGTFTVPFGVTLGQTGMRIIVAEGFAGATLTPCLSYGYGETEDFIVDITASTLCTGTPAPGNTLASASSVCPNGTVVLSLQNQATLGGGNNYQWYNNAGPIPGATNPSYSAIITAADNFYCSVTCTTSSQTANSAPVAVGVSPFFNCYCIPTNAGSACITNVTFGTLSNTTAGCPGGTNYNAFPTPNPVITIGNTETLSVTCDGGAITSVWIDYNQDGTYSASEWNQVYTNALTGSISITIPFTATPGLTGMRVRSRLTGNQNGAGDACLAMGSGETEDFVINLQVPFACSGTPTPGNTVASASSVCPNTSVSLSLAGQATIGSGATYQWYNNAGLIPGATNPTYSQVMTSPDDFYCNVTCTASAQTTASGLVSVGISGFANCYCSTGLGGSCAINAMSSVDIAGTTLNNVTGGCTGTYNAFPASGSTTATLLAGNLYTMNVGVIAGSNTQVAIWIDANQNGVYETTEYTLINGNITSGGSGSGTFSVPITALAGNTGMRVRSDWQGTTPWTSADACTNRTWGETEDYVITIVLPAPCSGTPAPGNTLASATAVCSGTTVNFTLQNPGLASGITYQWYNNGGAIAGATNSFYSQVMTSANAFYCDVTCSGQTGTSVPVSITINSPLTCYCAAGASTDGQSTSNEYIGNFTFNTINNTTGSTAGTTPPGYVDYTTISTNVLQGSTYTASVLIPNWFGGDQASVWIDFNHDGLLDDITEQFALTTGGGSGTTPLTGSITIPTTALTGATRMRVRGNYTGVMSSCGITTYGEVEDYTIVIDPVVTSTTLNLTAFIQAYWDGTAAMSPALSLQGQGNPITDCDSITVELRTASSPLTIAYSTIAVLHTNGTAACVFPSGVASGYYYIAVKGRNIIETWSADSINITGATVAYNFSTAASQAYGSNQIELTIGTPPVGTGIFAIYSGDIVKDAGEATDLLDLNQLETEINNFSFGYFAEDLNGDGNVDILDSPSLEGNISGFIYSIHP